MKTALLLAMTGIVLVGCNSADAHQAHTKHDPRARDFLAMSPAQPTATALPDGVLLRGPTGDSLSTATGGPAGGLPDRN